jgi:hypothetical protein
MGIELGQSRAAHAVELARKAMERVTLEALIPTMP